MRKAVTVVALLVLGAVSLLVPVQASAGSSTDAALALGAFAVFNQIFGGYGAGHVVRETVVVQQPAVMYAPPPPPPAVIYAPPPPPAVVYAPAPQPVVIYRPYYYPSYGYVQPGYGYYRAYGRHRHYDDD